ncbi:unnamed protein product, partial [Amoebophrya sp. A25]|eukprot:GSA25T00015721001.1
MITLGPGAKTCTPCPPGTAANSTLNVCALCPIGYFSADGGKTSVDGRCTACPVDTVSIPDRTECRKCGPGSMAIDEQCMRCPAGYVSTGGADCTECPAGEQPDPKGEKCMPCQMGFFKGDGDKECRPCQGLTISLQYGAKTCDTCPDGKQPSVGNKACVDCNPGAAGLKGACATCPDG